MAAIGQRIGNWEPQTFVNLSTLAAEHLPPRFALWQLLNFKMPAWKDL
jgi:hypothetical protein